MTLVSKSVYLSGYFQVKYLLSLKLLSRVSAANCGIEFFFRLLKSFETFWLPRCSLNGEHDTGGFNVVSMKILISCIHTSMWNFCLERSKIGSMKARDMIFVPKSILTRAREFNGTSRKILKSYNHALHDIRIFIDAPLKFPVRVELLNNSF